jgi:archaellum component FlaC
MTIRNLLSKNKQLENDLRQRKADTIQLRKLLTTNKQELESKGLEVTALETNLEDLRCELNTMRAEMRRICEENGIDYVESIQEVIFDAFSPNFE